MSSPKIAVVGSYVVGMTMRAPRFAVVGESLIGTDFDMGPGGKGSNQAIGAARLGAQVNLLEKIGKDIFAQQAIDFYISEGMDTQYILQDPESYTGVAFITLNPAGENLIVVDVGANERLSPEDVDAFPTRGRRQRRGDDDAGNSSRTGSPGYGAGEGRWCNHHPESGSGEAFARIHL